MADKKKPAPQPSPPLPTAPPLGPRRAGQRVWRPQNKKLYLLRVLAFAVFAGLATYYSSSSAHKSKRAVVVTNLPESYALCAEPGKVYTVDEEKPNVDCVLVKKDRILATGALHDVQADWDSFQTELVNKFYGGEPKAKKPLKVFHAPKGSVVLPGLTDAHAHLIMYGTKMQLNLEDARMMDDVLDRIELYVISNPDVQNDSERWIQGFGWDQTRWKAWRGGFPSKHDLESRPLLASRLIALSRVDGHALWVSPRALEIAEAALPGGRWPEPGEVEGGEIMRDKTSQPTGVFLDAAMALVPVPPPSQQEMEERADRAVKDALAVGVTSVHDAATSAEMVKVFKLMADEGRLPIRVYAMANEESAEYWGDHFERLGGYGKDGRLTLKSVKLFTDGALGSWGAALLEPYSDKPSTTGIMRSSEKALRETVFRFWEDGWGVSVHCIGDRANKAVLDIFEELLLKGNVSEAEARRPRIEHAQIMRAEDLTRAGRLGVITSVQPTHATSDMGYAESRLGPERIKGAYAYHTLLQSSRNKVLPLGSDFPVEGINPLLGFYAAVSRLDTQGKSPHGPNGWFAEERLTRAQALKGMTLDAAYASFAEHDLGSLVAGKKADLVVLDTDIMRDNLPFSEILEAKVKATVIDGRIMYGGF